MKLLLDTQCFILYVDRPDSTRNDAPAALEETSNQHFLSLVSPWEMQVESD